MAYQRQYLCDEILKTSEELSERQLEAALARVMARG